MFLINWVFLGLMLLAIVALYPKRHVISLPNLAITLGVLGTFVGIFWGLYNFDVGDIQNSIPKLLEGLKLAFISSIAGMLIAILLRIAPAIMAKPQAKVERHIEGATLDTVAEILEKTRQEQEAYRQAQKATEQHTDKGLEVQFDRLERALSGDQEGSLRHQLQLLQGAMVSRQEALQQAFDRFAERMASDNSTALIEALSSVMRNFNTQINEQFGDNFKHLNQAVTRVVEWQSQYALQVESMIGQFDLTVEGMKECERSVRAIAEMSGSFTLIAEASGSFKDTSQQLDQVLQSLNERTTQLSEHLSAFANLSVDAQRAFPLIEANIVKLTHNFSAAVEDSTQRNQAMLELNQTHLKDQLASFDKTQSKINEELRTLFSQLHFRSIYGQKQGE